MTLANGNPFVYYIKMVASLKPRRKWQDPFNLQQAIARLGDTKAAKVRNN
jgi:hypothetical protein